MEKGLNDGLCHCLGARDQRRRQEKTRISQGLYTILNLFFLIFLFCFNNFFFLPYLSMRASLSSTIKIYRCLLCNGSIGIYRKLLVLWMSMMSMDFLHWSIKYYTKGRKLWCYQCYQVYICLSSYVFFFWWRQGTIMLSCLGRLLEKVVRSCCSQLIPWL